MSHWRIKPKSPNPHPTPSTDRQPFPLLKHFIYVSVLLPNEQLDQRARWWWSFHCSLYICLATDGTLLYLRKGESSLHTEKQQTERWRPTPRMADWLNVIIPSWRLVPRCGVSLSSSVSCHFCLGKNKSKTNLQSTRERVRPFKQSKALFLGGKKSEMQIGNVRPDFYRGRPPTRAELSREGFSTDNAGVLFW